MKLKESLINIKNQGRSVPVFITGPDDAVRYPAMILIHEIFGLNEHIKDVARRCAGQAMRVFAPDLFAEARPEQRKDLDSMRNIWSSIPDSRLIDDVKATCNFAKSNGDINEEDIGALGFCMGGAIAFMSACSEPSIAWVVDFYGRVTYPQLSENKPKNPVDYSPGLKCPVLGIFAGNDELITPEDRALFVAAIQAAGQKVEMQVYDNAPHAFFNDTREHYNPQAAAVAWESTLRFIKQGSKA